MSLLDKNISSHISDQIEKFEYDTANIYEYGYVVNCGDGIVVASGLPGCKYGELLEFENDAHGIAMNIDMEGVGAVLLNGIDVVNVGSRVRGTGRVLEVPVGNKLIGRVVDPIGRAIDEKGEIHSSKHRPIECEAPSIMDRQSVSQPLQTGILSIDSMIPIGRGQRELIIGDRQTGKTAIAIDTILNQKGQDVICIYVAIGQKASTISQIVNVLEKNGAMEYSIIVASTASDCAAMQYITPYAGAAIAEEFMYAGKDVLIVYDDLTKHAVAYRTMSLLLRRPPGREAYPGDVFYLHSRLLERAAKLSEALGGGSITALPIIETMAGDISAYIPTNVISITDGQLFLETELFHAGVRPAINVGLSVSRVGGAAQRKSMRSMSGQLRMNLAQYRELAIFVQFGSDLDKTTKDLLAQGERLTESLKQKQYNPLSLAKQIILLYAVSNKYLDGVSVKEVGKYNKGLLEYMESAHYAFLKGLEMADEMDNVMKGELDKFVSEYTDMYLGVGGDAK